MSELSQAVDRIRRWNSSGETVYHDQQPRSRLADAMLVSDAYLAEHPADEDEPITEEWLESVGFYRPVDGGQLTIEVDAVTFLTVDSERTAWRLTDTEPGDSEAGSVWIDERHTRGDVYRLAKVLGIELKAGVEA